MPPRCGAGGGAGPPAPQRPPGIQIAWRSRRAGFGPALLRRVAAHVARAEGFNAGSLSIAVVGLQAMTTLHRRYLGSAQPTDVLAFDLGCDRRAGILDGQIVLCAELARRQGARAARSAAQATRAARRELALYLVHGLLHLSGYDDRSAAAARRMHRRQDELLSQLGLGPAPRQQ